PGLDACADEEALLAAYPPPADPALRARVDDASALLDRSEALSGAGNFAEGLAVATAARERAEALQYPPLLARAHFVEAMTFDYLGRSADAAASLHRALRAAAAARDDQLIASAQTALLWVVGYQQGRNEQALALKPIVEASVLRAGNTGSLRAEYLRQLGVLAVEQGALEQALDHFRQYLKVATETYQPDDPRVARAVMSVGRALSLLGRFDEARGWHERAIALQRGAPGPDDDDADLPHSYLNLGRDHLALGHFDEARAALGQARALFARSAGPEHSYVGGTLSDLAYVEIAAGH